MSSALVVRRDGPDAPPETTGFEAAVEALGHTVERRLRTERAQHNRYGVGPETVEELAALVAETDAACVAVDDDLHPGQLADLAAALPAATVRDRRGVLTSALAAAGNPVAENRAEEWTLQVERRRLANERRAGESTADDRIADTDRQRQRLDDEYETLREAAEKRVATGHETAGARVVLTRTVGADGTAWSAIGGNAVDADPTQGSGTPLGPGTPTTESVPVAAGTVALTAVPAVPIDLPEWYREAVPGTTAALQRADAVVLTVDSGASATETADRLRAITDAPVVVWAPAGSDGADARAAGAAGQDAGAADDLADVTVVSGSAAALRERVTELLPTTRLAVRLPYDDDAHALVSWLHGNAHVVDVDYGDAITATVVAFAETVATVRRRVDAVGGTVTEE